MMNPVPRQFQAHLVVEAAHALLQCNGLPAHVVMLRLKLRGIHLIGGDLGAEGFHGARGRLLAPYLRFHLLHSLHRLCQLLLHLGLVSDQG